MTIITRDRDHEDAAKLPGPPPIEAIARGHNRAVSRLVAQLENDSFS